MTTQNLSYCGMALLVLTVTIVEAVLLEGDVCTIRESVGKCMLASQCLILRKAFGERKIEREEIPRCKPTHRQEVICCPHTDIFEDEPGWPDPYTTTQINERQDERSAIKACREIEAGLPLNIGIQILDGTAVVRGEFPHMAAIGFHSINATGGAYEFACGGTLISKRFVLTAAHCLASHDRVPKVVRLGVTNYSDTRNAVEAKILLSHIYPTYRSNREYDDIALVELESDVQYSQFVYPTCLHTELVEHSDRSQLFVTGWGGISNTTTQESSNQLLKAKMQVGKLDNCSTFHQQSELQSLSHTIDRDIIETQICAYNPGYTKDACRGDSGGPLNLILDNEMKFNYRVVGVIATGFSCGTKAPSIYTRVASYLQFIEDIVWPTA